MPGCLQFVSVLYWVLLHVDFEAWRRAWGERHPVKGRLRMAAPERMRTHLNSFVQPASPCLRQTDAPRSA